MPTIDSKSKLMPDPDLIPLPNEGSTLQNSYEEALAGFTLTPPNPYAEALWKAYEELQTIKCQEADLALRKSKLRKTVDALYPIVYPGAPEDINSLSLADAIRLIIKNCDKPVSAKEVRNRLYDLGYDLSKYNNPLASVWTASKRMIDAEELELTEDEDEKKLTPGPTLKTIPDSTDAETAMDAIAQKQK
jgi:hypothetical protein